jgi:transcriptional regulator with XRE-family HTH domain
MRLKLPISQRQFAMKIGFLPSTLSNYENSNRMLNVSTAWKIVIGLQDLGLDVLFHDVFPPQTVNNYDESEAA